MPLRQSLATSARSGALSASLRAWDSLAAAGPHVALLGGLQPIQPCPCVFWSGPEPATCPDEKDVLSPRARSLAASVHFLSTLVQRLSSSPRGLLPFVYGVFFYAVHFVQFSR